MNLGRTLENSRCDVPERKKSESEEERELEERAETRKNPETTHANDNRNDWGEKHNNKVCVCLFSLSKSVDAFPTLSLSFR